MHLKIKRPHQKQRRAVAFTLVELLVVIGIIALLGTLTLPGMQSMLLKARGMQCAANLRSIGVAVMQAASDNNNTYPEIDQAAAPIYPTGSNAKNLVDTLSPYGITTNTIKCPVDLQTSPSSYSLYKSSYEWNPMFDDGSSVTPILYINANVKIPVNSTRVRLCYDFASIHHGHVNAVYGDGHVSAR